ncbi:winged helix DNA-binding domain-containing protein [Cellulomonas wangsupingiae]|uniref:Winged helix DNA-binding domain-containing protein n=1 Tax=Cellulomonas wangsupingiae TaxID=2968085 RepID=A0ABY5K412_9CELL|nr:winged helix DNA-binding domain-containing protein [Cellulomonas wangsupingiae]MCC2335655.1 winged helix DNA-binding domain-containing protein [Cellulomonas wangsupingiae]MCM0640286.1 winged helix DNA-binding domain-containing protein [Cellulomonas wangsupingiae]UUI63892.1 winged helix DNA-binding domain-containing protein [Cellulomonas wangsupingiae]
MLDDRALNRALLARQHLLARTGDDVPTVVEHLVGLQAQNPWSPFVGLWSRVEGFSTRDLDAALLARTVVRVAAMRSTVHLLTARDAPVLTALARPVMTRELTANPRRRAAWDVVDLDRLVELAAAYVRSEPRVTTDLGARLAQEWPAAHPQDLSAFARALLPLVQVTPRGLWRHPAATTWTTLDAWLPEAAAGADLRDDEARRCALETVVLRYLAAFGPASVADVQAWSGLRGLREVVDGLRDRLLTLPAVPARPGGRTRELLDLPDAPRPDADVPAPVRLLPDYDNVWLSHAQRSRVVDDAHRRALQTPNGRMPAAVLVDGSVRATWVLERGRAGERGTRRTTATLTVTPLERLSPRERRDVLAEAERCVRFVADDADAHAVRYAG